MATMSKPDQWIARVLSRVISAMGAGSIIAILFGGTSVLVGNMVKLRAQCVSKSLVSSYLNEHTVLDGLIATTYWDLLTRVYRLEGVAGLLRGIVPTSLQSLVLVCSSLFMRQFGLSLVAESMSILLLSILSAPLDVLVVRTLTAPEPLPYVDIRRTLHTLLMPEERARPWLLYLIPGILPIVAIQAAWNKLFVPRLRKAITPYVVDWDLGHRIDTFALLHLGFLLLDMVVLVPLETVTIRLSLMNVDSVVATAGNQVLSLRTGQPPYVGAWDCISSIMNQEGYQAFYRAWWLSLFARLPSMAKTAEDTTASLSTRATEKTLGLF